MTSSFHPHYIESITISLAHMTFLLLVLDRNSWGQGTDKNKMHKGPRGDSLSVSGTHSVLGFNRRELGHSCTKSELSTRCPNTDGH
jgi:hypothetical protein